MNNISSRLDWWTIGLEIMLNLSVNSGIISSNPIIELQSVWWLLRLNNPLPCCSSCGNTMATKNRIADMHPIIQIIKIVPAKSPNQTCLRWFCRGRVGVERKGLLVAQKTPKNPVITGNSEFWRVGGNGAVQPPCNRENREKALWLHRGDFNGSQWLTAKSRKTYINCYLSQFVLTTDWLFFYAKKFSEEP